MSTVLENRINSRVSCELRLECIKISGRSDVFVARSINYSRNGLGLVSRNPVKTGTHLIVRVLDFPRAETPANKKWIRAAGMAEVRWIEEIRDPAERYYVMGVRYLFTD
jgi:hypothetical protein